MDGSRRGEVQKQIQHMLVIIIFYIIVFYFLTSNSVGSWVEIRLRVEYESRFGLKIC